MTEHTRIHLILFSALTSGITFTLILLGVVYKIPAFLYDDTIGGAIRLAFSHDWLPAMLFITNLASPVILLFIGLVAYAFLIWRRRGYYDLVLIVSATLGLFLTVLFKWLLDVPRPIAHLVPAFDASFPSGHTAMATVVFLVIAYAFRHEAHHKIVRWLFEALCFATIVLVGISRIYLGAHRPTEVVAGFLLGVFCVSLARFLFRNMESRVL